MNHGIILAGGMDLPLLPVEDKDFFRTTIKRAAGAYRIASYLRERDWDIEVLDFLPSWDREELIEFFDSRITKDTVFVGMSSIFDQRYLVPIFNGILDWLKENYPHVAIIAGAKQLGTIYVYNADYYVTGYGEFGLEELLKKLTNQPSSVKIETVTLEDGWEGKVVNSDVHHPAYPCKDLQVRYEDRDFLKPTEELTLELSRGCRFRCKFCTYNILGVKGDYSIDMNNLYEELQRNNDTWGIRQYSVADETTNENSDKLRRAAEAVQRLSFKPSMRGYIRADMLAIHQQDWENLIAMGYDSHFYGIESLNYEAAKSIGKGLHPDKLKQGLIDAKSYWLKHAGHFNVTTALIVGLLHETPETFWEGYNWIDKTFPEAQIVGGPLRLWDKANKTLFYQSELDNTWEQEGKYKRGSFKDYGAKKSDLNPKLNKILRNSESFSMGAINEDDCPVDSSGRLNWYHDTMNFWQAICITSDIYVKAAERRYASPNIWAHYNYTSIDQHPVSSMNKSIEELGDPDWEAQKQFFEEYKWKKLSL